MSNRLDKTNSENVQSIAQIGMTKRKCKLEFTFCSNVEVEGGGGFEGFYNLSYKKIKNIIYKGLFKNAPNPPLPSVHKQ